MKKKIGRPTEQLKDTVLKVRVDSGLLERLDAYAMAIDKSRSEVIRELITQVITEEADNTEHKEDCE